MLIKLHMFKKHSIYPSVYMLIQNVAANIFGILATFFLVEQKKVTFLYYNSHSTELEHNILP